MNFLQIVTNRALNDRRHSAERITEEVAHAEYGINNYRPTLLELDTERRARKGKAPSYTDKASGALLPPGGTAQLRDMVRKYRRKARKQAAK